MTASQSLQQFPPRFISLEGGDGTGKSTQIQKLRDSLSKQHNIEVITTREPGGLAKHQEIRNYILSGKAKETGIIAESLLFSADRAAHMHNLILPALNAGKWVLSDRFVDSTTIYQGQAGVPLEILHKLSEIATFGRLPDMTFILDMPVELSLKRMHQRAEKPDRYESEAADMLEKRRNAFRELATANPKRCKLIDATQTQEQIAREIYRHISNAFFKEKN